MAVFRELRGVNVKFLFSNPEKAQLARNRVMRENRFEGLSCGPWAVGRTREKEETTSVNIFDAQFRAYGEKKPLKG